MKRPNKWYKLCSFVMAVVMLSTTFAPLNVAYAAGELRNRIVYETAEDLSVDSQEDLSQAQSAESEEIVPTPTPVPTEEPAVTAAPEQPDAVLYQDGVVYIYTAQQLAAIGSGQVVCSGDAQAESFGTGDAVLDENGQAVVYGLDARYLLTQDIPLEAGQVWVLPENFAGVFVQEKMDASAPLYNAQTDTIYIYNNYQLQTIAGQDVLKTVLSGDNVAETFGMGQVQYADEAQTQQLEYTAQHNYVVAQTFTAQMPELKAQQVLETAEDTEGRQYKGQVIYVENGKTYILIGNEQQLRAIGSTDSNGNPIKVTEPVWVQKYKYTYSGIIGNWKEDGSPIMYYPGDADISEEAFLFDDPEATYKDVGDDTRPILNIISGATGSKYFGSKQNGTGTACDESADEYNVNIEREKAGLKDDEPVYSTIANYIIFRDIELTKSSDGSANWKPLMFSGTMEGRKNMELWENVTISHINVQQTGKLDASQNIGIGFFGTLTNQADTNQGETKDIGLSGGTTVVKDINLSDVTVSNTSTEMKDKTTVIGVLTDVLGGLLGALGGLVDGIIGWIPGLDDTILGDLNLKDVLGHLLDARAASADTYATGAFAGRIIGDVLVEDCHVKEAAVSNVKDMTGGFVGNVEGLTEYDGLSEILEATTGSLESILNLIPGLGLGDLITILLKNPSLVNITELIPSGYKSAHITNCSVQLSNGAIASGTEESRARFAGGFAGLQTGSVLENCSVTGLTSVTALKYAGGFSGATRDAVIEGLLPKNLIALEAILAKLQEVIDKTKNIDPSSKVIGCTVQAAEGKTITVNAGEYAGGFTGLAANSDISNSQVQGVSGVSASSITYTQKDELGITKEYQTTGDYAGGFAGRVTLGSSLILAGETDIVNNSLLGEVGSLTENVLTGESAGQLLSVLGVSSSKLQGCKVTGSSLEVSARNYAGGLFGQGDGPEVTVPETSAAQDAVQEAANQVENLVSVTASENYAGGIAGKIVPANAAGAVNKMLGIANALKFTLNSIEVSGAGYTVAAKEFAGGGIGQAFGGTVDNVTLDGVKKVSAENYAAGFLAQGGPGSLVNAGENGGGLDLLGLGLIKVNSLLALGEMLPITMDTCVVKGSDLLVEAIGANDTTLYFAGGFIGENASGDISNSHVEGLQQVKTKTYAGGFAARSQTGGLAEVGDSNTIKGLLGELVSINNLLGAVKYLIPTYTNCYVQFSSNLPQTGAQVEAQYAGGFIGEMQGGTVDNSALSDSTDAVRSVAFIKGTQYAGGFGGKVVSGGLADSNGLTLLGGLEGLKISLNDLLSVLQAYVPVITSAGVSSVESGLRVQATEASSTDPDAGSAGGYAGLVQGARITNSDVKKLATKKAASNTVPNEDDWAVSAPTNAGGYAGQIDIGNAAAVGGGLSALKILNLGNLLSALQVVESRLDCCDVYGATGGFNVQSTNGSAGGYAGLINGAWINGSDSYDYEYIYGVVSAGGYVGTAQPGDVASVVEKADLLNGLLSVEGSLLSLAKSFIPRIYNSCTEAVPCGGYVKATGTSDGAILKGMAGGYAGYNQGGRIWGNINNDPADLSASPTILPDQKLAETKRVREVVGQEFAGGFTGLMKAANIADTGNFSLLYGLVETKGLLSALEAVYATETNTKTTGPLRDISYEKWNAWVEVVGSQGVYGEEFKEANVNSQDELNRFLENYIYGYTVEALAKDNGTGVADGGSAGGYVGRMEAGVITNAYAQDVKSVTAHRSAGGFAGEMVTGTVANVGGLSLGDLKITDNIGLVSTFVPVIYASRTDGYRSGMTITATGESDVDIIGSAGGFAGTIAGGQIWADIPEDEDLKFERVTNKAGEVKNLRSVSGTRYAGGFAGRMDSGSTVTEADMESPSGLLNGILGLIINSKDIQALADVLNATIPTVESAAVNKPIEGEEPMQFSVQDASRAAGGFVGAAQGAVLGEREESSDPDTGLEVYGVRSVKADEHAGGFFGLADMGGVAQVANSQNSILGIIALNNVDVLNSFRTYFYDCKVNAPADGLSVYALKASADGGSTTDGTDANQVYCTGNAGGFGGSLLNATVLRSSVTGLKLVNGVNYVGGFVGLSGKSGVVDLDNVAIFGEILNAAAGVLDIFGSHIDDSTVTGMDSGFTVSSKDGKDCIAGGFVGYADLSRINAGTVENIKQVYSDAQAGGFAGRTSFAYLADVDAASPALLDPILSVVNRLLELLYADKLQDLGVIKIELGDLPLSLEVFSDGNTLSVNLLGLKISVALVKGNGEGVSDVAQVHIGDSYIELPCTEEGGVTKTDNIKIGLIKANRTKVADSKITGVSNGYDVFGGGAGNTADGTDPNGYAGGFVGYNNEGLLENNNMYQADTIRGTSGLVGEFSGKTSLETEYPNINNLQTIEGSGNCYRVYRINTQGLDQIKKDGTLLTEDHDPATGNETYDVYTVLHRGAAITENKDHSLHSLVWQDAYLTAGGNQNAQFPVNVYLTDAEACLMLGVKTEQNTDGTDPEDGAAQDPCAEEALLTIHKIWVDNNYPNRPTEITVQLWNGSTAQEIPMNAELQGTDPNIWTYTTNVPVRSEDGKYVYTVSEEPLNGYLTIYYQDPNDDYTFYIFNILQTIPLVKDTVVIDYGLSVDVDVLANDLFEQYHANPSVVGVLPYEENEGMLNTVWKDGQTDWATAATTYGTAEVKGGNSVRYTLNGMKMRSLDRMLYVVQMPEESVKNGQNYMAGLLTVIPATEIFYEDNFNAISYNPGKTNGDADIAWEKYTDSGSTTSDVQDTDRPTEDLMQQVWDDWYGNDTHYADDVTYSNGTVHYVSVDENTKESPNAQFSFTGTGFDVISVTSGDTGVVNVTIKQNGERVASYTIDTYYGYTYQDGKWVVDQSATGKNALYQIPILKVKDLDYGTYDVTITPQYFKSMDAHYSETGENAYSFYLDAIRVYDPADQNNPDYKEIEEVYKKDNQSNPDFKEIRDAVLSAGKLTETQEGGVVFVDGNDTLSDMADYATYGPKNELYLAPGQAISFYLWTDCVPDKIELGAKLAKGNSATLRVETAVQAGDSQWDSFRSQTYTINSAYDMYYNLDAQCVWEAADTTQKENIRGYKTKYPIVIRNASEEGALISLTNLRWTNAQKSSGQEQPVQAMHTVLANAAYDPYEIVATASWENVEAAYYLLNPLQKYFVTVKYQDSLGNKIAEDMVQTVYEGSEYDVSALAERALEGYNRLEVRGAVSGVANGNVEIVVVYEKVDAGALPETQPSATPNPGQTKPGQSVVNTGAQAPAGDTAADLPGVSQPQQNNLGGPYDIPDTSVQEKVEGTLEFVKKWAEQQANMKNVALIVMGIAIVAAAVLTTTVKKRKSE